MKNLLIIMCIGLQTTVLAQVDYSKYENSNGTSMMPIIERAIPVVKNLEEDDLEIVRLEFDIVSASGSISWRVLHKDINYAIGVVGDYRVKDIDMIVYKWDGKNKKWILVDKDKKEDSSAVVDIRPTKTQEYKIETKVYQFYDNYDVAHFCLFVLRN